MMIEDFRLNGTDTTLNTVVEIAEKMPQWLRQQRALLLVWEHGGRMTDQRCPACDGQPIVGHQLVDYEDENENEEVRDGIVPVMCALCRGFGSVSVAIDEWFRDELAGVGGEPPRFDWRDGARKEVRTWGRAAEGTGMKMAHRDMLKDMRDVEQVAEL